MDTRLPEEIVATNGAPRAAHEVALTPRQASVIGRIIATLALHTERAARWFVLLFQCALFVVCVARPDRLLLPVVFALLIFTPMWWRTMFPRKDGA